MVWEFQPGMLFHFYELTLNNYARFATNLVEKIQIFFFKWEIKLVTYTICSKPCVFVQTGSTVKVKST
jgi:hypothetical protein